MDQRYFRRLLEVAAVSLLCAAFLAATPAFSFEDSISLRVCGTQTDGKDLVIPPRPVNYCDNPLTATAVLPPDVQSAQLQSATSDSTLRRLGEGEENLLRNGLVHSSRGMQALTVGDRAHAREELETLMSILSSLSGAATPSDLRLQLIEETALLKAALSGAPPDQELERQVNEQEEEEASDTEAAPDLVVPEAAQGLPPLDSEIVSMPEPDTSNFDVPIVLNEQVKDYIQYYQTRKWGVMSRAFERSGRYLPMMREIFREQGLPQDLVNLAYVESAFNYRAYSRAKASGIWQFIKATGSRYGMRVNYWLDERRDPEKATRAAAAYLKDLYEMFHSWPLALAAYNTGEYRIQRAIDQQGTTDFWALRLPKETDLYVPAFMAITIITKDPNRYGFVAPEEEPWEVERATVPGAVQLRAIARAVGVPFDVIRDLNPAVIRGVTPPTAAAHEINLPPGTKAILLAKLDQLPRSSSRKVVRTAGRWHRVRRGETMGLIASQHETTAARLARLNGRRVDDRLMVGTLLRLPLAQPPSKRAETVVRAARSRTPTARAQKGTPSSRSTIHIVKRGETLWGIAQAYAVTPEKLRRWNGLGRQVRLKPGQTLQVAALAAKGNREAHRGAPTSTIHALYHRVKSGDTLWEIARAHDVTPEELRRWNDLGREATLHVGQKLMIRLSES